MSTIITVDEARERFENGFPVGVRDVGVKHDPVWQSAADGWARTFDEFINPRWGSVEGAEREYLKPRASRRTQDEAAGCIFRREEFEIGNLSGTHFFLPEGNRGDLDEEFHASFDASDYAVWSFATPIAWIMPGGEIIMPPLRYSQTTTQHQYLVARALGVSFSSQRRATAVADGGRTPYGPRGGGW